jgi:ABC-type taurine transport system ATPase subunit
MLTKLVVRNFKRFDDVEIPLGNPVVFIGPNNSGKTTALQALALWELGLRRWKEKRSEQPTLEKRPGVAINRLDLLSVPMPSANLLWRGLRTRNIRIDVMVEGNTKGVDWRCGLEFDFANEESFFCRPLRLTEGKSPERMLVPEQAYGVRVAFLPPMSGLAANETRLDSGAVNVRLGEGRTAEVLRNLCYSLATSEENASKWDAVVRQTHDLFQVDLERPEHVPERGEVHMGYRDYSGVRLDLSSSGRGLQQTLLLLAYLALHPGAVLLLDEPDAHLEVLRQREIFQILSESARSNGSQLIIASHSEEILNQAAETSDEGLVAFLGKPHRIPRNRTAAVRRALNEVRIDQYYLAEQKGWVLYLENRTDLNILRAFATRLKHPAGRALDLPFFYSIGNQPNKGRQHFDALAEAKLNLEGYLLVDHDAPELRTRENLLERKWERREIENYICQPETLESFAKEYAERALQSMRKAIEDRVPPAALRDRSDPWWANIKASDEFLDLVFPGFFQGLGLKPDFPKASYHELVRHIPEEMISPEVVTVLDEIDAVARKAHPAEEESAQDA